MLCRFFNGGTIFNVYRPGPCPDNVTCNSQFSRFDSLWTQTDDTQTDKLYMLYIYLVFLHIYYTLVLNNNIFYFQYF